MTVATAAARKNAVGGKFLKTRIVVQNATAAIIIATDATTAVTKIADKHCVNMRCRKC